MPGPAGLGGRHQTRRHRRSGGGFRLHKPRWVDPFPWIPGTEPEKRIFEALVRRGIYFKFQFDLTREELEKSGGLLTPSAFKPDFIVPEYKVIIDPFSDFHHSLPDARKRDVFKYVLYVRVLGYKFYTPWSSEVIREGGLRIIQGIPEFYGPPTVELKDPKDIEAKRSPGYRLGPNLGLGANSVAAANKKRARSRGRLEQRTRRGRGRRR